MLMQIIRNLANSIATWIIVGGVIGLLIVGGLLMRIAKRSDR